MEAVKLGYAIQKASHLAKVELDECPIQAGLRYTLKGPHEISLYKKAQQLVMVV
jgi:hypothetical protein